MPSVSFIFELFDEDRKKIVDIIPDSKDWYIIKIIKNKNMIDGYSLIIPKNNTMLKNKYIIKDIKIDINNIDVNISEFKKNMEDINNKIHEFQVQISEIKEDDTIAKDLIKELNILQKDYNEQATKINEYENSKAPLLDRIKKLREDSTQNKDIVFDVNVEQMHKILDILPKIFYVKDLEFLPESIPIQELIEQNTPRSIAVGNLLKIGDLEDLNTLNEEMWRVRPILRYTANIISDKFSSSWKQERLLLNLIKESDNLVISIQEAVAVAAPPQERSEGFQWFLSFFANFMLESNDNISRKIILLDEPAIRLHPKGQKDFLEVLESISKNNQVIYTSHSPFLVNKSFPHRIRILEKDRRRGSIINNKPYSNGKSRFWEPLKTAIGVSLGDLFSIGETNLIVEGVSDQILLTGISHQFANIAAPFLDLEKITIVPAMGALCAAYLGQFCISEGLKAIVLLDNDSEGRKTRTRVKKESLELNVMIINEFKKGAVNIEDLLPRARYIASVNSFYNKIKLAEYKNFEEKLDEEKLVSLNIMKELRKHFRNNNINLSKVSVAKEYINNLNINEENITDYESFLKLFEKMNKSVE
ncbi:MAG: AAA family ATPase [Candidatus Helarchaeota archaeon]|nr:AAA family ATPase [Candidatus Helarchaeota archaeon]